MQKKLGPTRTLDSAIFPWPGASERGGRECCTRREARETPRRREKARHNSPHPLSPLSLPAVLTHPLLSLLSPIATGGSTATVRSKTAASRPVERTSGKPSCRCVDGPLLLPVQALLGDNLHGGKTLIQALRLDCS
jgi:hypothetical protein